MKIYLGVALLVSFCLGCRTIQQNTDHCVVIAGIDGRTGTKIPVAVFPVMEPFASNMTFRTTQEGLESNDARPRWRYNNASKTVSIVYTNDTFEALVASPGYSPTTISLKNGFSGPVNVIMKKEPDPNKPSEGDSVIRAEDGTDHRVPQRQRCAIEIMF